MLAHLKTHPCVWWRRQGREESSLADGGRSPLSRGSWWFAFVNFWDCTKYLVFRVFFRVRLHQIFGVSLLSKRDGTKYLVFHFCQNETAPNIWCFTFANFIKVRLHQIFGVSLFSKRLHQIFGGWLLSKWDCAKYLVFHILSTWDCTKWSRWISSPVSLPVISFAWFAKSLQFLVARTGKLSVNWQVVLPFIWTETIFHRKEQNAKLLKMKYDEWKPETVVSWFVSKGEEKSKEKTRCACQHVGCPPSLVQQMIIPGAKYKYNTKSLVQRRTELRSKKRVKVSAPAQKGRAVSHICQRWRRDHSQNKPGNRWNQPRYENSKKSCCFCLFITATSHPPRKDPIGHSPVPEGKEWEKGRQHKFAISACVYALLLGPTLNMNIFISDSDAIAISSCFFFITCLQTSQQSVRCLQAYKPPLPGRFPSWNRHIFKTCLFSPYPCPTPHSRIIKDRL